MNLFYYTGDSEQPDWPKTFKTYYQTYDKVMKVKDRVFEITKYFLIETIKKKDKK